jgi:hypothetical protein
MVLQLHPFIHLAAPADRLQATRCVRLVRGLVPDRLGADPALRARDQGPDAGGVGPGLLRLDPETCVVPAQERAVALQSLGLASEARAAAAVLQAFGGIDGIVVCRWAREKVQAGLGSRRVGMRSSLPRVACERNVGNSYS